MHRVRDDIKDVLNDSPSLERELAGIIARETERARRRMAEVLADLAYDESQILGAWMPD